MVLSENELSRSFDEVADSSTVSAMALSLLLTVCYFLSVIDRQIIAYLATDMKADLGLSDFQIGLVQGFAFSIFYALAGMPLGWAVDRFSRTRLVCAAIFFWSVMTASCGAVHSFVQLLLARMGVGVGEAVLTPATYSILPDVFPAKHLPISIAFYASGAVVSGAAAAWFAGVMLSAADDYGTILLPLWGETQAWRATFVIAGLPGLGLAVLMFFLRDPARRTTQKDVTGAEGFSRFLTRNWSSHLLFSIGMACTTAITYALIAWVPSVLERSFDWSPGRIGAIYSLVTLACGAMGCLLGAIVPTCLLRNGGVKKLMVATIVAATLSAIAIGAASYSQDSSLFLLIIGVPLTLAYFFMSAGPTILQLITPAHFRGRMSALFLLLNVGVGAGAGPTLVGLLTTSVLKSDQEIATSLSLVGASFAALAMIFLLLSCRKISLVD